MRVLFHPRAVEDAVRIGAWWKANRPAAPALFERELHGTLTAVAQSPTLGSIATASHELPDVRRVLMKRTRYHIYYRVIDDALEVLAVWHAARGAGPTLE